MRPPPPSPLFGAPRMKLIRRPAAMSRLAAGWRRGGRRVVLVPTMGALHAGHLALVDHARRAAGPGGVVVVSIFVNPLQFGPKEDLSRYPRPRARDLAHCRARGVDVVFHPDGPGVMYAADRSVEVNETELSAALCGRSRPGHFRGVCTVVAKLFHLVGPDAAVFGTKDYQQLAIVRRMVRDLDFPVRILSHPTEREPDGLARSSRNENLSPAERAQAPAVRRALLAAGALVAAGERRAEPLRAAMAAEIARAPLARVDYLEVVDAETLRPLETLRAPALLAAAVFFGNTRLIDNQPLDKL